MTLLRTIAILMAVALTGMALGTSHHDSVPIVRTVRYGPPAYGGPPMDELVDQLDATRTAARIAQEAADAAEAQRAADEVAARQRAVQTVPASPSPVTPPGGHSDLWWSGVAGCEEGGNNDAFYGYFGKIDGAWAGLSWEEQVARGNALLLAVGHEVGPWAQRCVNAGYAASPSG